MPGFDPSLDKQLFSESVDFEKTKITVGIYAYNNSVPKLQISRENKNVEGEASFAKLGRMTKDEIEKVLPIIEKAIKKM